MNPFDELLSVFDNQEDKETIEEIFNRNPKALEQIEKYESDLRMARQWKEWAEQNYVYDAYGPGKGATKRELEKDRLIQELQAKLNAAQTTQAGEDMTFEQLNEYIEKLGVAKKADLQEFEVKAQTMEQRVLQAVGSTLDPIAMLPIYATRYYDEFHAPMSEEEAKSMLEHAYKANVSLDKAYEEVVRPKREEIEKKKIEEAIQKAKEEGRNEAIKELSQKAGMGTGSMPVEDGGDFDTFLEGLLGGEKAAEGQAPPNVELGKGVLARHAAKLMAQTGGLGG